jgi:two-component system OmpR family response regulator
MTRKKILIIDDETSITRLLKLNLENTGHYTVREENRGVRSVATARDFKPDLVLLDVMMPDIDGGDVAAQFQRDPVLKNTRIIFLTAAVKSDELAARGNMIGGFPYIAKPLDVQGVLHAIEQNLGKAA